MFFIEWAMSSAYNAQAFEPDTLDANWAFYMLAAIMHHMHKKYSKYDCQVAQLVNFVPWIFTFLNHEYPQGGWHSSSQWLNHLTVSGSLPVLRKDTQPPIWLWCSSLQVSKDIPVRYSEEGICHEGHGTSMKVCSIHTLLYIEKPSL